MIEFLRATRAMLPQIGAIEQASFPDPWSLSMLEAELDSGFVHFHVAVEDGQVLAFCILRLIWGEGEIYNIAVAPAHRGRGIGEGLLRHCLAAAAGEAEQVFLEVRASNQAAQGLYKKLGFVETGLRRGYYLKPREDAVLMTFRYGEGEEKC